MEFLHQMLTSVVDAAILLFEFVGVAIIIISGLKGIANYLRHDSLTGLNLAKGMAMGLEDVYKRQTVHRESSAL